MNDKIEKRLNDIPVLYKNNYRKAMNGKNRVISSKSILFRMYGMAKNRSSKM